MNDIRSGCDVGTGAQRQVLTGSLQQEFMGIPPAGQAISVEGMNFYRLKNGRVADIWTQFDAPGMMQQLGAAPGRLSAPSPTTGSARSGPCTGRRPGLLQCTESRRRRFAP